jgi:anti-sigma-K factor RskA
MLKQSYFVACLAASIFSVSWNVPAIASDPVGTVTCSSLDGTDRTNSILFAAIQSSDHGVDLLIVEEIGTKVLSLNSELQVTAASTLQGQTLSPWNLVAYDGAPVSITEEGAFSINMMVSTRSSCQFEGIAIFQQSN